MGTTLSLWKKVLYALSWVPALIIVKGILWAIGVVLAVPLIAKEGVNPDRSDWLWLWGNDEDDPFTSTRMDWYFEEAAASKNPIKRKYPNYWWLAMRNSVGNIRFLIKDQEPNYSGTWPKDNLKAKGLIAEGLTKADRWAWKGVFAGYKWMKLVKAKDGTYTQYREFWAGWKIGHATPGLGMTFRVPLKRDID